MQLALVRTFVLVAEAQSFTAAAKALRVPTSSVSRSVSRLERELGSRLFERTTRRTMLSAAGRAYYEHARQALRELEQGEARVAEILGKPRGQVRLTIPIHLDSGFLASQLVAFSNAYPQVTVLVAPSNRWLDLNADGFDLALRVQQTAESELALRELGRFHAWLVSSPTYLKAQGTPRRPSDLQRHVFVNLQSERYPLRLLGPSGLETVEVGGPLAANDMHFARQLVERGGGIGPLIFSPGDQPCLPDGLIRVLPDYVVEGPRLFLASTSRKTLPLRVRLLRDFLVDQYSRRGSASAL
jgi:DNA-binding transcriptional LysR family regulator